VQFAWLFTIAAVSIFFAGAWQLNRLALELRLSHSRFSFLLVHQALHELVHLFLGIALEFPARRGLPSPGGLDWRILILCARSAVVAALMCVCMSGRGLRPPRKFVLGPKQFGIAARFMVARIMHRELSRCSRGWPDVCACPGRRGRESRSLRPCFATSIHW